MKARAESEDAVADVVRSALEHMAHAFEFSGDPEAELIDAQKRAAEAYRQFAWLRDRVATRELRKRQLEAFLDTRGIDPEADERHDLGPETA